MKYQLTSALSKREEAISWADLVVFLSDLKYLDCQKIKDWAQKFCNVTVAGKGKRPARLPKEVAWYSYANDNKKRSEIWNRLVRRAEKEWVLFVEDDEQIRFSDFPKEESLASNVWSPALIRQVGGGSIRQFYQMRLVNTDIDGESLYEGQNLPDCTRYIREKDIKLYNRPILIERESSPVAHIDVEEELSVKNYAPKLYLVQGDRYFQEKKYVRSAAQYRQLLKKKKLLPFDRLAAVNGLASCMAEQHKWTKAMTLTQESIKAEPLQSLPYLIQYKIHKLQKEWQKAHAVLRRYFERQSLYSRASFDKIMDGEITLVNLANIALKAGNRQKASDYFEELFTYKRGDVDRSLLYKVLVLSIELSDFERSVHLFNRLFKNVLPDQLDEEQKEELNDIMDMFMAQEWYGFVADVYNKLHNAYPGDQTFKRRLIVVLTKTNRLDKARNIVANIV